jgi:hypothetical protein
MKTQKHRLINFLKDELGIPSNSIQLAVDRTPENMSLLPMILWKYGLVNLQQLEKIWDWMETVWVSDKFQNNKS